MAELKTQKNDASVADFIARVEDPQKRADAEAIDQLLRQATGDEPAMWGDAIVGYGERTMVYANGKPLSWMKAGFSPRKANLSIYLPGGYERLEGLLAKLGPHKTGVGCLYIKRLRDVDVEVLREIVKSALTTLD